MKSARGNSDDRLHASSWATTANASFKWGRLILSRRLILEVDLQGLAQIGERLIEALTLAGHLYIEAKG